MYKFDNFFLVTGVTILILCVFVALFPGVFSPYGLKESFDPFLSPDRSHILGTNDMGYDIFTELVHSARISLGIGLLSAVVTVLIGTIIGALAGYLKNISGEIFTGIIDVFLLIPVLPLLMVLAAYTGPNTLNIIVIISLLGWCSTARAVRSKVMQVREMMFIEALASLGIGKIRIMLKHIISNVSEVIWAKFVVSVAWAMLSEASLSFMGLGDPNRVTWGGMMHFAFKRGGFMKDMYSWYVTPGLCIAFCAMAFVFIGMYMEKRASGENGNDLFESGEYKY